MADIYRSAKRTIVLDRHLQKVPDNPYEMGIQLLCSEWGRRLWTLQEAVLPGPDRLLVLFESGMRPWYSICNTSPQERIRWALWISQRFGDQMLSRLTHLNHLEDSLIKIFLRSESLSSRRIPPSHLWNPMEAEIRQRLDDMIRLDVSGDDSQPESLLRVASAVCRRSTTRPSDEFICIGHLMGLDFSRLDHPPTSFEELLEQVPIPENLIFVAGPRVRRKGFRWAPASLLGCDLHYTLSGHQKRASVNENGISINKAALVSLHEVHFQSGFSYRLIRGGKALFELNFAQNSVQATRPVFLMLEDYLQLQHQNAPLLVVAVNASVDQMESDGKCGEFLFNLPMGPMSLRLPNMRTFTIDVRYQPMEKWTID